MRPSRARRWFLSTTRPRVAHALQRAYPGLPYCAPSGGFAAVAAKMPWHGKGSYQTVQGFVAQIRKRPLHWKDYFSTYCLGSIEYELFSRHYILKFPLWNDHANFFCARGACFGKHRLQTCLRLRHGIHEWPTYPFVSQKLIAVPPRSPRPAALEGNPLSKDCKSEGPKYINNDQKL